MSGVVKAIAGYALMFVGIFTGNLMLAKAGFYLAGLGIVEEVSKLFTPEPPKHRIRQDVEYSGTVTPRRIIYGKLRVGALNTVRPLVVDPKGKLLHQVLTIAAHPVNAISAVYFNQDTVGTRTAVTGTANDGLVTTGTYANLAWVRCYTGAQTAVDYILNQAASSLWTSNHIGYDLTYAALTFKLDDKVYASGKPEVSFLVEGKKCYDPRLDTSPGANPTNASYIAYTTNPALQLADYLLDANLGMGIAAAKIDWDMVVTAANVCDEDVTIPPASPATTQKRFTSSVVLEASADRREDNIKALAGAMMGVCFRQGGKYRMYAGAELTPSFALTQADIVGNVSVRLETPTGEKYNQVRGTFTDADRNYQEVEFEPRGSAAYESADGRQIPKTVNFDTVTNAYEAQRNAIILRRRSRMRKTLTGRFSLSAFKIRPFEVGTMTFADIGWSAQRVVCTSWQFVGDGTIEMVLQEDSATIWDDPAVSDYTAPGSGGSASATSYTPDPPDNLAATPIKGAIEFDWDMPLEVLAGDVIELWEHTSSTPFASATKVWEGNANRVTLAKSDTTTRYYWIRARALNTNTSTTEPATTGVSAAALPAPVDGADGADGADGQDALMPVPDPFFERATDQTYWKFYQGDFSSAATNISISGTGGVIGGKLSVTGDSSNKYAVAYPSPLYPVVTTQEFKIYIRWRRTGTLTGTGSSAAIVADGSAVDAIPVTSGIGMSSGVSVTIDAVNATTVNQWQESSATLTVNNNPKNQTQLPYGMFYAGMTDNVTGGTVEIDAVVVTPI